MNSLATAKYFSLQLDGSTDAGNVEDEVFLTVFCDLHSGYSRLHVPNEFQTVTRPSRSNAEGLLSYLHNAMGVMRVTNWESKLIRVGCDGASVNMGHGSGLKGLPPIDECTGHFDPSTCGNHSRHSVGRKYSLFAPRVRLQTHPEKSGPFSACPCSKMCNSGGGGGGGSKGGCQAGDGRGQHPPSALGLHEILGLTLQPWACS